MWQGINLVHLVVNEHGPIFAEQLELLQHTLEQCAIPVRVNQNRFIRGWLNLLVGHTMFVPPPQLQKIMQSGCDLVVLQLEALDDKRGFGPLYPAYFELLHAALQIWDYSPTNVQLLQQRGYQQVRYLPIGFSSRLERIPRLGQRPIDVLFCGTLTPRRKSVLDALTQQGIRVVSLFNVYGAPRDRAIADSKIVLNLHQFETSQLEQVRLSYLLNNRCFVVSERSDCDPYGGGVVFCSYEELVTSCLHHLAEKQASERERIAEVGYRKLREVPMGAMLTQYWLECQQAKSHHPRD